MTPSGYTATLEKGEQSFEDFVLDCARAFGALIDLRDDPDAPIPDEFQPSSYHVEGVADARKRRDEVLRWTDSQAASAAAADWAETRQRYQDAIDHAAACAQRYVTMIREVEKWEPPTSEHRGLKDFMLQQLRESLSHDGDATYYKGRLASLKLLSAEEYREREVERADKDIAYHLKHGAEDAERARQRSEWVRALRESL